MTDTFDPTALSSDAMQPTNLDLLGQLNQAAASKPKRGRPVGSRNKPKEPPGVVGMGGPSSLTSPRGRSSGTTTDAKSDPLKIAAAKAAKTAAYTERIVGEFNDNIMLVLSGLGIPAQLLYKPGKEPVAVTVSDSYGPLGNAIAVKPHQAKAVASFLTELEFSSSGQRMAARVGTGPGPLALKGLVALAATGQWVSEVRKVRTQLAPFIAALQAQAKQQADNEQQPNQEATVTDIRQRPPVGGMQ